MSNALLLSVGHQILVAVGYEFWRLLGRLSRGVVRGVVVGSDRASSLAQKKVFMVGKCCLLRILDSFLLSFSFSVSLLRHVIVSKAV